MEIKVPTSWDDITIGQFINLNGLSLMDNDPIDYMVDVISIACNQPFEVVSRLDLASIKLVFNKLSFINDMPTGKLPHTWDCDGVIYDCKYMANEITAGQYVDFKTLMKDNQIQNMHKGMAILFVPKGKQYNDVPVLKIAEVFYNKMPMSVAYPLLVFFCEVSKSWSQIILDYSNREVKEKMKEAMEVVAESLR